MKHLSHALWSMYNELNNAHFDVILVPAPVPMFSGHKVRMVNVSNPQWYKDICSQFITCRNNVRRKYRKHVDTRVKRQDILALLKRLATGQDVNSKYKDCLLTVADRINDAIEQEIIDSEYVPF